MFLALVNDAAHDIEHHWKYVDDLSLLEIRTTSAPPKLQDHLNELENWSKDNDMKFNTTKSNAMSVNFTKRNINTPCLRLNDEPLKTTESQKILGVHLQSNLKWDKQVGDIVSRAGKRVFMISRLRKASVPICDLVNIYSSYIRPLLEYSSPLWSPSITANQYNDIEKIQKRVCRIIMKDQYVSYDHALEHLSICRMSERHEQLLDSFARSLLESPRHRDLLPPLRSDMSSRRLRSSHLLNTPLCRTTRYYSSTIPTIVRLLNSP
eukprot:XP_011661922.1 PREDICTED: uncharacterized protein LOC105437248 [Strongylocentrotus purpuratus]